YLGQVSAQNLDKELMSPEGGGFVLEQLMELAGLAVAEAVVKEYDVKKHGRVLVCCGPGNNGGDVGLVTARHLAHFGYQPRVYWPKRTSKAFFQGLHQQLKQLGIGHIEDERGFEEAARETDVIVDAIFGFSFHGEVRAPFDHALRVMKENGGQRGVKIVSVDMPSGWDVEKGPPKEGLVLRPDTLVSLTWPKEGAKYFTGASHYLGGRFIPPEVLLKYGVSREELAPFQGYDQCVKL
ncbi:YjeF N-terminal domain-containing protein, partial [Piptocephalis cylindrospora]